MEHKAPMGEIFNFGVLHLEWPTALFIFVVFSLTMLILNTMLFKPVLRSIEGRQSILDKRSGRLEEISKTLTDFQDELQAKSKATYEELGKHYQEAHAASASEAAGIISAAKETAQKAFDKSFAEIDEEKNKALKEAETLSATLAGLIHKKVLG